MLLNIYKSVKSPHPVLNLGFRIFFLAAAIFAIVSMLLWYGVLHSYVLASYMELNPAYWHAHEMIFGYAFAVVAGFLFTAVQN